MSHTQSMPARRNSFAPAFLNLSEAGFRSESSHCRGGQEGVELIDPFRHDRDQVEETESDGCEESDGEPWRSHFLSFRRLRTRAFLRGARSTSSG